VREADEAVFPSKIRQFHRAKQVCLDARFRPWRKILDLRAGIANNARKDWKTGFREERAPMTLMKMIVIVVIIAAAAILVWQMGWIGKAAQGINESFDVNFAKGQTAYQSQQYGDAIQSFQKALQLDAKNSDAPNAMMRLAECYSQLKQPDEAKRTYEKLLNDYPDYKQRDQVTAALEKLKLGTQ
jgi:tetratricopeptide (TPR) repeat protein